MTLMNIFCIDLVYNEIPIGEFFLSLLTVAGIIVVYMLRKIPPFNIIWGFLVAVFVYALLGYVGKKLKDLLK